MKTHRLNYLLLAGVLMFSACSKKLNVQVGGMGDDSLGQNDFPPSAIAIKNYDQIFATYSVLTEVPRNNTNLSNNFTLIKASLPVTNELVTMTPSVQLANFKLAQLFCREGMNNTQLRSSTGQELRRVLYAPFNFDQTPNPNVAFIQNPGIKIEIVRNLLNKFWGTGLESIPENAEGEYLALFDTLVAGVATNQNNFNQTLSIMVGVCSAILSASPTILF